MSNGKGMKALLIVGLIKKLNEIPLYKNESVLSQAVQKFWREYYR